MIILMILMGVIGVIAVILYKKNELIYIMNSVKSKRFMKLFFGLLILFIHVIDRFISGVHTHQSSAAALAHP